MFGTRKKTIQRKSPVIDFKLKYTSLLKAHDFTLHQLFKTKRELNDLKVSQDWARKRIPNELAVLSLSPDTARYQMRIVNLRIALNDVTEAASIAERAEIVKLAVSALAADERML